MTLSKREWIASSIAVVFIAYMFLGNTLMGLFFNTASTNNQTAAMGADGEAGNGGVQVQDELLGTGPVVQQGMQVGVNYVLKLADGTIVQDSKEVGSGEPFKFIVGSGQVIAGWDAGITGMKVGGKRMIIIPPALGYGTQQIGPIPPNSTLIFEIEVVSASFPNQ